ncbi:hypothetical protein DHEL01_v212346 [Diaporthe helianthi]|uniref:Uncharacterized protein n=1 Tax=Diaporthe helianthi TaxID=158607 RepID=A0A2P5HG84_DIAHE|nr:hypothetical protein DHEL01_v212346 [Diaporthe helianthi]
MASLLPLLYDLFPIIMPSKVRISRDKDLIPIPERAEPPPYHQIWRDDARQEDDQHKSDLNTTDDTAGLEVGPGKGRSPGPIRLLDREESSAVQPRPPTVYRRDAMVGVTDKMCATGALAIVLTVGARSASAVHHHGEQVYATRGNGVLLTSPAVDPVRAIRADIKGEAPTREEEQPRRHNLCSGDFAFIPAWTEHQVVNESDEGDIVWVFIHNGGERVQVDLVGWGGGICQGVGPG